MRAIKTKSGYRLNNGWMIRFYDHGNNYWYNAIVFFCGWPDLEYHKMTKVQARSVLNDFKSIPRLPKDFYGKEECQM